MSGKVAAYDYFYTYQAIKCLLIPMDKGDVILERCFDRDRNASHNVQRWPV